MNMVIMKLKHAKLNVLIGWPSQMPKVREGTVLINVHGMVLLNTIEITKPKFVFLVLAV